MMCGATFIPAMASALICMQDGFYSTALKSILKERLRVQRVTLVETLDQAVDHMAGGEGVVDLALFDLRTPGLNNRTTIQALRAGFSETRVVVIAATHSRQVVLSSLEDGVHGFLNRDIGVAGFVDALNLVSRGQIYVPPFLACPDP